MEGPIVAMPTAFPWCISIRAIRGCGQPADDGVRRCADTFALGREGASTISTIAVGCRRFRTREAAPIERRPLWVRILETGVCRSESPHPWPNAP